MRIVYVNGEWVDEVNARISVFDRGFTFADAIYEVTAMVGGKLIDFEGHAARRIAISSIRRTSRRPS